MLSGGDSTRSEIEMTLGVAILGTGRLGGRYIDSVNASDGAETRMVAEPREEQVSDLRTAYPNVEFVGDYHDVLGRDDIDTRFVARHDRGIRSRTTDPTV